VRFSPDLDLLFIFLSNRVHPKDPGSLGAIVEAVRRVWDVTVEAITPAAAPKASAGESAPFIESD
jgi:hypothetical protein